MLRLVQVEKVAVMPSDYAMLLTGSESIRMATGTIRGAPSGPPLLFLGSPDTHNIAANPSLSGTS